MPDRRSHRGPHPEDAELFSPGALPALRAATGDLVWLASRGYAAVSSLKLVGDRYHLAARQRTAVGRCACSEAGRRRRGEHELPAGAVRGLPVWLDGYNVLTTVEAAMSGGVILHARDGTFRDMASMHGSYRKVEETRPAAEAIGRALAGLGTCEAVWYLDRPVSNSGRLKGILDSIASAHGWPWRVGLVADPDPVLRESEQVVATADSAILDHCRSWLNLARLVVERYAPEARVVEL